MDNSVMFKIGYGLYVLTAKDEFDNGCIINTLMQVTSQPNRISITVNKQNLTHDMILKTGIFNVSILSTEASYEVFKHFGFQSGKNARKFDDHWSGIRRAPNGVLFLSGNTNAYISGKVWQTIDLGTHTMFIADVTEGKMITGYGTLTYDYYQNKIKPRPDNTTVKKTSYRCKICGYIYEGEELPKDFICPTCKHGAEDFEKIVVEE